MSVVTLMGMLWTACGSPQVDIGRNPKSFESSDYEDIFWRWSRDLRIIPVNGGENYLTARATYLSYEFRRAYSERRAHDLRLSENELQAFEDSQNKDLDKNHEFFVSVMSGISKSDDLDPQKGTWNIKLEDDKGRHVLPLKIEKIRKPTFEQTTYFKFDIKQRKAYKITFPLTTDDGQPILSTSTVSFSLLFSSPLGQGNMRWETTALKQP